MNETSVQHFYTIDGSELIGLHYEPIFPYFKDTKNAFVVLNGEFVNTEDGTGVVHMAPAFGEDDHALCKQHNIPVVCPVDDKGEFTSQMDDLSYKIADKEMILSLSGKQVFDAQDDIIKYLKGENLWIKTEQHLHNYPHCWRTDTPLIYKTVDSWYVAVTKFKDRMVELNQQINWIPSNVKNGIFGKWLENTRDWSISRKRFWGCPLPIWKSTNPKYRRIEVYGSIQEIEDAFGEYYKSQHGKDLKITNLHRPFIDTIVRPNPDDPTGQSMMVRVEDVLDCWFESGSMPFANVHYPFDYRENGQIVRNASENIKWFNEHFPADFIVEYVAQTRGWFYTLMVLGTALFDRVPFLNCICHGVILDENSQKLSKRLRNYPDPQDMFEIYGSDAMRFMMCSSSVVHGDNLNMDKDGAMIKEVARSTLTDLWNAFSFLQMYMDADGLWEIDKYKTLFGFQSEDLMDIYITSKLHGTVKIIKNSMDAYDLQSPCHAITNFLNILNNWYIRRNKKRFWETPKLPIEYLAKYTEWKSLTSEELKQVSKEETNPTALELIELIALNKPHCLTTNGKEALVIDVNKMWAYGTLYSAILTLCQASAPLLPCLTEKIYLELMGEKI